MRRTHSSCCHMRRWHPSVVSELIHVVVAVRDLVRCDDRRAVRELVASCSRTTVTQLCVSIACELGACGVLRLLLDECGGSMSRPDANMRTPLIVAYEHSQFALIRAFARYIDERDDVAGRTLLFAMIDDDDAEGVRFACGLGASVNVQDNDGWTPLHYACQSTCSRDVFEALLEHGADVRARSVRRRTPMHEAASVGDARAIMLLLDHGASIHSQDDQGRTPLHCACQNEFSFSSHEHADARTAAVLLLLDHGADVHQRNRHGRTPLCMACAASPSTLPVIQLLLQRGASLPDGAPHPSYELACDWRWTLMFRYANPSACIEGMKAFRGTDVGRSAALRAIARKEAYPVARWIVATDVGAWTAHAIRCVSRRITQYIRSRVLIHGAGAPDMSL